MTAGVHEGIIVIAALAKGEAMKRFLVFIDQ